MAGRLAWLADVGKRINEDAAEMAREMLGRGVSDREVIRAVIRRAGAMSDAVLLATSITAQRVIAGDEI